MVKVRLTKSELIIELSWIEKFLSARWNLKIPLKNISSVPIEKKFPKVYFRIGTSLPWIFVAGSFYGKGGWHYLYFSHIEKCITINLKEGFYKKIIVEAEDNIKLVSEIKKAAKL